MSIVLTCGLHDPEAGLAWMLDTYLPVVQKICPSLVITATPGTNAELLKELRRRGCKVAVCPKRGPGHTFREAVRRGHAVAGPRPTVYMDFDRVLHWARVAPAEFARVMKRAERAEWFVGERTPRAYRTHQRALIETEAPANEAVSKALGERRVHDYLVPCLGLSRPARMTVLRCATRPDFSMYGLWLMALSKAGFKSTYLSCDGFDWETPDQHREAVKKAGGVAAYRRLFDTPDEWEKRRMIAADVMRDLPAKYKPAP